MKPDHSPCERSRGLGCSRINSLEKYLGLRETKLLESGECYLILSYVYSLYSSPNIIGNLKLRRLRRARYVIILEESISVYRVLIGRPEGKRSLGRPRRRWEDNIKINLKEVGCDARNWMELAQDRDQWRDVRAVMNLRVP